MQNSGLGKTLIALTGMVFLIWTIRHFSDRDPDKGASSSPVASKRQDQGPSESFLKTDDKPVEEMAALGQTHADEDGLEQLSREKVEEYLKRNDRGAESLLAAFHALDDTNYLHEAAANFPNDPQLQWTILAHNTYPEDRRKWLDLFKTSSPDNSLANYLSASDYFKTGQSGLAVKELLEASSKKQFKDYAMEARLNEEELSRATGKTALESTRAAGWAADVLPGLANFKGLARAIGDTHKEYLDAGDSASANDLLQMQLTLGSRLSTGEAGKLMINQLVGMSIEAMALRQLEQKTAYEFLGGKTPTEKLEEVKQQRESLKEISRTLSAAYGNLNESEMVGFSDRAKAYGEVEAARWLQQRSGTNVPSPTP